MIFSIFKKWVNFENMEVALWRHPARISIKANNQKTKLFQFPNRNSNPPELIELHPWHLIEVKNKAEKTATIWTISLSSFALLTQHFASFTADAKTAATVWSVPSSAVGRSHSWNQINLGTNGQPMAMSRA